MAMSEEKREHFLLELFTVFDKDLTITEPAEILTELLGLNNGTFT